MRTLLLSLLLLFGSLNAAPPSVKVLVRKKAPGALIEVRGAYKLHNPSNEKLIAAHVADKRYYLFPHNRGIKWGDAFSSLYQIRFSPESDKSSILVDGIQYKGAVEVYNIDDVVNIVNEVDIETFLSSYLSMRFSDDVDKEVMDAVSIVARTNAYSLLGRNERAFWHFDGDEINFQGYALTKSHPHVDEALLRTHYMVMTFEEEPFPCSWTVNSAGQTASYAAIHRKEISTPKGIHSAYAARDRQRHKWSFNIPVNDLSHKLGKIQIKELDLYQEEASNKVFALKVRDELTTEAVPYPSLQKILGNDLKSNDFSISLQGDEVLFTGFGEGDGVGLCLYSALLMAEKGQQAPEILGSLFPDTKLVKIEEYPPSIQE